MSRIRAVRAMRNGLVTWGMLLAAGCGAESATSIPGESPEFISSSSSQMEATPFLTPGISRPALLRAKEASIPDDCPVAGLIVDGEARAYALEALSTMWTHVINDLIGTRPITVTYCDQADCLRILTRDDRSEPLVVSTAGWNGQEMLLMIDGVMYPQTSQQIPLGEIAGERTTWKKWREKHPDSKIYAGHMQPPGSPGEAATAP